MTGRVVGVREGPWEGRTYPDVVKGRFVGDVIQQEQGWRGTDSRGDQASVGVLQSGDGSEDKDLP